MSEKEPLIAKALFDDKTHSGIIDFVNKRTPLMSLQVDETTFIRKYSHNTPFFVSIHRHLSDFASEQFGEPLKPSYVFLSMYEDGGICPLHIDRPQCYRTIDYLITQDDQEPWPILIGEPMSNEDREKLVESNACHPKEDSEIAERIAAETWHEVLLMPNDAVLYSGTHSWHYRPKPIKGKATLVFFHFVPEAFDGPLD
ncbi:MAG: hypothetical protein O2981_05380 [Proteobacteria bacterium]|nr:hypothetical protein [Pseudomonadota bacterium]